MSTDRNYNRHTAFTVGDTWAEIDELSWLRTVTDITEITEITDITELMPLNNAC